MAIQTLFRRALRPSAIRNFSQSAVRANELSPEEVLQQGFRKMREMPNYKKSEEELKPLLTAAKALGISEASLRDIYQRTTVENTGKSSSKKSSGDSASSPGASKSPATGFVPGSKAEEQFLLQKLNTNMPIQNAHFPFKYDDIPSLGHLQLRDHRVQREYNRIAAYELPQLAKFASEYKPPTESEVLRFRYTTYMGEDHAGEAKVVVTFKTSDLTELNDKQRHKLRLLAGPRYDHTTDTIKMSSSAFPEAAQNVRYLGDIINSLVSEAKDLSDSFEDIPLSTSHVEARKRRNKSRYPNHPFPESWKRPQDAPKSKSDAFTKLVDQYAQLPKL
ncbi:mitochondrial 37S ribosomal protein mS35 [Magnusiomyces paraingens]|uniref:Small ribosomal subunit protein mS35 n=1 Tax=Magnusiomyces paraingens TaxID=2606893 RepID=A0A5E8B9L0_9ASCO|nr:uncharacterized protein SAPINGB_P000768 [Saprochaete ingens]VVT45492.1 unnamed protein product [Saprochaete ingens]